ncbi:hypothetical protein HK096_006546, partial [Nowakowskiella sp. JEL0078]
MDDFGLDLSLIKSSIELAKLAKKNGIIQKGHLKLSDLCVSLLGFCLPKPKDIRIGRWDAAELSEEQIKYA